MNAERPSQRRRDERGVAMLFVAIGLVCLLTFTALAIDIGLASARTRDLQQVADLVAVDVARVLNGQSEAALQTRVDAEAIETATSNNFPVAGSGGTYTSGTRQLTVDLGCWTHAVGTTGTFNTSCTAPDAVRAIAQDAVDYKFADVIGIGGDTFDRTATATQMPTANVGVGGVAAGLRANLDPVTGSAAASVYVDVLNGRLKAAFDTAASVATPPGAGGLDIVSYRGLAASTVTLGDLATAAGFATPSQLANATMTNGQLFEATADALDAEGNGVAAAAVRSFAARPTFDSNGTTRLASGPLIFEQGTGTADDPKAAATQMNVMDLLVGAATVENGRNFVSYQFNPGINGVTNAVVQSSVVEPMQWKDGTVPTYAQSSQIRHQVTLSINGSLLGIPGLSMPITLPIIIEGASADGTLSRIDCREPDTASLDQVDVVTSLARFRVGIATNLATAGSGALTVSNATVIQAAGYNLSTLIYLGISGAWALGQNIVGSGDVSLGGGSSSHIFHPLATPNPTQRATGGVAVNAGTQLQSHTTTNLTALGSTNLLASLSTVFTNLGARVIDPILQAAGVTLGGADVGSTKLECNAPQLVD